MELKNPITCMDYPDPDVIRVGNLYYMVSTTMHFLPGCVILRSYDLVHWEIASYVYDILEDTPRQRLSEQENAYGKGMWAASLRWHQGRFYVCFSANDIGKTFLYTAEQIEGPWKKQYIEGFYHDSSLLFDEDRVWIVYGNTKIYLTELSSDLTGPKPGGLHRLLVQEPEEHPNYLGYEGSHIYKINGRYYLFLIHWPPKNHGRRLEACFMSDSLTGTFVGGDILDDDLGYCNQGVAQGGIVDTPDGRWFGMLFQDRGAVGRIPVLVPMHFDEKTGMPVMGVEGKVPLVLNPYLEPSTKEVAGTEWNTLFGNDSFQYPLEQLPHPKLKACWQWNHMPDKDLWEVVPRDGGYAYALTSGKLCSNLSQTVNTLTQRSIWPGCRASVTLDGSEMKDGDFAGLCALQGSYGFIGITREQEEYFLVMVTRGETERSYQLPLPDTEPGKEWERKHIYPMSGIDVSAVTLQIRFDFEQQKDTAEYYYRKEDQWIPLGIMQKLYYTLDHFTGYRFGLFLFSTKETGGKAYFTDFCYEAGQQEKGILDA